MKEDLEKERRKVEKEMEESKLQMRNFKLNKLIVLLNSLIIRSSRNFKYHGFTILQRHQMELDLKYKKMANHNNYNQK